MRIYPKTLKQEAAAKVSSLTCKPRKILLIYAAVAFGVSLVAALMNLFLNGQIARTGGLDGLEVKALWETTATVSELAMAFLSPIWSLGLVSVVLGFARGKEATPKDLTSGFSRFLPGLALHFLSAIFYIPAGFVAFYVGTSLMGALANTDKLSQILQPFTSAYVANPAILQDGAFLNTLPWLEILSYLWIPLVLTLLLAIVLILFLAYRLRLAKYYLMDGFGMGPVQAMRKSFSSMKGHVFAFIGLDLHYWWYYGLMGLLGSSALATVT
jgi:uncharacterized membrane protein